jgi:hypothetical protein
MSVCGGEAENICSHRVFRILTRKRHCARGPAVPSRRERFMPAGKAVAASIGRGLPFDLAFRLLGIAIFGAVARRRRLCPATSALFHNRLLAPAPEGE